MTARHFSTSLKKLHQKHNRRIGYVLEQPKIYRPGISTPEDFPLAPRGTPDTVTKKSIRKFYSIPLVRYSLQKLETRVDVLLFRSTLAPSVLAGRRWVLSGRVKVNGVTSVSPLTRIYAGDVVSLEKNPVHTPTKNQLKHYRLTYRMVRNPFRRINQDLGWRLPSTRTGTSAPIPEYLHVDFTCLSFALTQEPTTDQLLFPDYLPIKH